MNAKLISGLDFHLIQNHNQIISQNLQTTPFFPSHLSFTTNISNSNPRLLLVSSFRNRATKVRAAAAETSAFYTETKTRETFYDLLGISESGTISEIKKAYKHLARKYHPDVSPPERTEEYTKRFILVQEAYETLSDPETRALYDRDLSRGLHTVFSATRRSRYHEVYLIFLNFSIATFLKKIYI